MMTRFFYGVLGTALAAGCALLFLFQTDRVYGAEAGTAAYENGFIPAELESIPDGYDTPAISFNSRITNGTGIFLFGKRKVTLILTRRQMSTRITGCGFSGAARGMRRIRTAEKPGLPLWDWRRNQVHHPG